MFVIKDETFVDEMERFRLRFTCEHCAHFCADRTTCGIRYPTTPHRDETVASTPVGGRIFFCKMHEPADRG